MRALRHHGAIRGRLSLSHSAVGFSSSSLPIHNRTGRWDNYFCITGGCVAQQVVQHLSATMEAHKWNSRTDIARHARAGALRILKACSRGAATHCPSNCCRVSVWNKQLIMTLFGLHRLRIAAYPSAHHLCREVVVVVLRKDSETRCVMLWCQLLLHILVARCDSLLPCFILSFC